MKTKLLFVFLWIVYLGFIGPWLISEPSTVAVLLGLAALAILAFLTYHLIFKESNP